ncbi:geranyltranstransferase [Companilactobacillus sp. RD055328]|uniref:polyprenyl synthetase family protein n=1 Tax=Companilactobacillus sp. RD055328 TaxID=2916634 RepID=UPI001FC8A577|nr:farnesyl diphosphate synthase [Companilactobacillus sp. RD055328]GKQ42556.1 geranyltranstransferase [Companilactobacillus sp. RD055328]
MDTFTKFQEEHAQKIIDVAKINIEKNIENHELSESMNYSLTAGGKRIRPVLFLAVLKTLGIGNLANYYNLSSSLEMIHTYSLIHDDLPEMDNDDLRRGKPTNHKVFGVGQAVLAGDALLTMSFEIIATDNSISPQQKVDLVRILSKQSGPKGMISGQWLDITNENRQLNLDELINLHNQKTGDLLLASVEMALEIGNSSSIAKESLINFAKKIGLAFQIKDDILDVISDSEKMGKQTQKDELEGKNTFPAIMGLDQSIQYLQELQQSAKQDLNQLAVDTTLLEDFLNYFNLGE